MQYGNPWESFCNKKCGQCDKPIVSEPVQSLIFIQGDGWYHSKCYERARHALAVATKIARWSWAIQEYIYYRENLLEI